MKLWILIVLLCLFIGQAVAVEHAILIIDPSPNGQTQDAILIIDPMSAAGLEALASVAYVIGR